MWPENEISMIDVCAGTRVSQDTPRPSGSEGQRLKETFIRQGPALRAHVLVGIDLVPDPLSR